MFPITVLSCTSLLKCLCSRYLSETSKPRRHHLTNHNTRLLSTRQSQLMFTVSQLSRTPNHTPTNNEMGVTRKCDVVLTRFIATVSYFPFLQIPPAICSCIFHSCIFPLLQILPLHFHCIKFSTPAFRFHSTPHCPHRSY